MEITKYLVKRKSELDDDSYGVRNSLDSKTRDWFCNEGVEDFLREFRFKGCIGKRAIKVTISDEQIEKSVPIYFRLTSGDDDETYLEYRENLKAHWKDFVRDLRVLRQAVRDSGGKTKLFVSATAVEL